MLLMSGLRVAMLLLRHIRRVTNVADLVSFSHIIMDEPLKKITSKDQGGISEMSAHKS